MRRVCVLVVFAVGLIASVPLVSAAGGQQKKAAEPWKTPELPGGKTVVTDATDTFVKIPEGVTLREGVTVAKVAPTRRLGCSPERSP